MLKLTPTEEKIKKDEKTLNLKLVIVFIQLKKRIVSQLPYQ